MAITNQTSGATSLEERLLAKGYKPKERGRLEDRLLAKGYKPKPVTEVPQEVGVIDGLVKAAGRGVTNVADLVTSFGSALNSSTDPAAYEALGGQISGSPSDRVASQLSEDDLQYAQENGNNVRPSSLLKSAGVNLDAPKSSNPLVNIANNVVEEGVGGALLPIGKVANVGRNILGGGKFGAIFGGISESLQQALGLSKGDADTTTAVGSLAKTLASGGARAIANAINPFKTKNIDSEALNSSKQLGLDTPLSAFSSSRVLEGIENAIRSTPGLGDKLNAQYDKFGENVLNRFDDVLNKVGEAKTPEVQNKIKQLYENVVAKAPNEKIPAKNVLDFIDQEVKAVSGSTPPSTKRVITYLKQIKNDFTEQIKEKTKGKAKNNSEIEEVTTKLITKLQNIVQKDGKKQIKQKEVLPIKLFEGKKNVNRAISEADFANNEGLLKRLNAAFKRDIETANPEWVKAIAEADLLASKTARREALDDFLYKKISSSAKDEPRISSISAVLNSKQERNELAKIVGDELLDKSTLDKLATVTQRLAKNRREATATKPSGLSTVGVAGALAGLYTVPLTTFKALGLSGIAEQLVTNQKLAQKLIDFGNKPTKSTSEAFIKAFEGATKMSALNVSKQLNKSEEDEKGKLLKKIRGDNESK